MSQAEGPQAEVGGCIGDAAQAVLNSVYGLVNGHVSKVKRFLLRMLIAVLGVLGECVVVDDAGFVLCGSVANTLPHPSKFLSALWVESRA